MLYIIDGYNLMHALYPGEITAKNLEEKRQRLIEYVVNFIGAGGGQAEIVFDSSSAGKETVRHIPGTRVSVRFATRRESADIIIGKLVGEALKKVGIAGGNEFVRIRVVSADWEVQKGLLRERVERIPPRHFIAEANNFENRVANSPEKDRMRWKLEHKVDVETLRKLEELRRGGNSDD